MNKLGHTYYDGENAKLLGLVRSAKRAIKLFENAVELGDTTAMYNLGNCCAKGDGVKLNLKKAMHFYRMSGDRGDAVSQNALGARLFAQDNFEEAFRGEL